MSNDNTGRPAGAAEIAFLRLPARAGGDHRRAHIRSGLGFLALVNKLQGWLFTSLPKALGFHGEPLWWPVPLLMVAGLLVGLTIRYLPGKGGHSPADGFKARGAPTPIELPGVIFAALATLSLGAVLGPEAPLIAIGGGLGVLAVRLARRDAPPRTIAVVAAAGSFASIISR